MDDTPESTSRRRFLAGSAVVGMASVAPVGSLAGCTGSEGTGATDADPEGSGDTASGGAAETQTPTSTRTQTPEGLRLETLDTDGSPSGPMVVNPQNEAALLDFFATWCAPCKPQMAELRTVREVFPDLHMLSLSREDDLEAIESFWVEYEGTWPVAQDPRLEAFREYDITRIPTLVVVDAEGTEVWRHSGLSAAEDIIEHVEEARA